MSKCPNCGNDSFTAPIDGFFNVYDGSSDLKCRACEHEWHEPSKRHPPIYKKEEKKDT